MLKLDATTHDLTLDADGRIARLPVGAESIAQRIKVRLKTHTREWAWDQTMGVDYRGEVLIKGPDLRIVRALIAEEITKVDGVRSIKSIDLAPNYVTRMLTVTVRVDTIYNEQVEVIA